MATTKASTKNKIYGNRQIKENLKVAVDKEIPTLIIGETGTGKTTIIKELAEKHKKEWIRFSITGETTVDEFVGKYELEPIIMADGTSGIASVWKDGVLLQAMKAGKWLVVDEINAALPEILFVLHSLLDDDRFVTVSNHLGERVVPHKDFRFFATMNPVDEYAGTKELNKAFQSRFGMILKMTYLDARMEAKIIADKASVEPHVAAKIADVGIALRKAKADNAIFYTCSTRDLIQWAQLEGELGMEEAFKATILHKSNGDGERVAAIFKDITGVHMKFEEYGYQMNVEFFDTKAKELKQAEDNLDAKRDQIVRQVSQSLSASLSKDAIDAVSETLAPKATETQPTLVEAE